MIDRLRQAIDPYILLMFATVALAALVPAQGRGAVIAGGLADAGIVFLFFLYGTRLSPQDALRGLMHWRLHLAILFCTFVLFPLLGLGVQAAVSSVLPAVLIAGILFVCLLPSTVQSSIAFTSIAGGNVPAALCAASASNIVGILITPLLAGWLMQTAGASLSFGVFQDIILQLLAPFLTGQLLRPLVGSWISRHKQMLGLADRGSILLIIYVAFSKGMTDNIWGQIEPLDLIVLIIVLSALLALVLVLTAVIGRRILRLGKPDRIVLQFCGSKKSLASGLPIASVLFAGPQLGLILLPLMIFHQLELVVCALLARRYAARNAAGLSVAQAS